MLLMKMRGNLIMVNIVMMVEVWSAGGADRSWPKNAKQMLPGRMPAMVIPTCTMFIPRSTYANTSGTDFVP